MGQKLFRRSTLGQQGHLRVSTKALLQPLMPYVNVAENRLVLSYESRRYARLCVAKLPTVNNDSFKEEQVT